MSVRPKLEERLDSVREELAQEDVRSLDSLARRDRGMCLDPEREIERRRRLAEHATGNVHRSATWTAWLKHAVVKDPADAAIVAGGEDLRLALEADKPNASASESTLLGAAVRASVAADLALAAAARDGFFRVGPDGPVAHPALAVAVRFMAEARQSLCAVGLARRAAPTNSLSEYLRRRADVVDDSIPVSAEVVTKDAQ